ncbi:MAG: MoaD/ThiS family protein [Sphingomonadales bacterium]|nr:MoaD/ThiS family protein [Sphingomonadales bacterium]
MAELRPLSVTLCGKLADPCGREFTISIPAAGCTAGELRALVAARDGELARLLATTRVLFCINDQIIAESGRVMPGDDAAMFPPVSGG